MTQVRPEKGKSLLKLPDSYTVIDIETNGEDGWMEPLELAALRVRAGRPVDAFQTFVRPSCPVQPFITWLTGITDEMTRDAPEAAPALRAYYRFLGQDILLGYNVHFDINCLYDASERALYLPLKNDFVDVLRLSRRYLRALPDRKQTTVARYFGLSVSGAHRALRDCEICHAVYQRLRGLAQCDPRFPR